MTKNLVRNGFIAAGLMNIGGVLVFSRGFTNVAINNADTFEKRICCGDRWQWY